jgi:hypothetical protein
MSDPALGHSEAHQDQLLEKFANTMNQVQTETITKAAQCADLLIGDLREAHKQTSVNDVELELRLRELTTDALKIRNSLGELQDRFS